MVLFALVALPRLPALRPAVITDASAQSQHGVDVFALPMHASTFEASFDHQFVGTFHRARPNRPPELAELRIVHEGFSFPEIAQLLTHPFHFRESSRQAVGQAEQGAWPPMFEVVQQAR